MNEERQKLLDHLESAAVDINRLKRDITAKKAVIVICGPTGIGKTELGIEMARLFDTDIVSADSMQVYRGLDIGTGKVDTSGYGVRQYMVDVFEPCHRLTVKEFRDRTAGIIETDFMEKGKIPLLVGGSGMYIKAIINGIDESPGKDGDLRDRMEQDMDRTGTEKYYERLKRVDSHYAARISKNDKRRILRALEVYEATGEPFSNYQKTWESGAVYDTAMIGLKRERSSLYRLIEQRVDSMFEKGLVNEVDDLVKSGFGECPSLAQAVGYKEVISFLQGKITLEECISLVKKNSRRLAKKQMTWFGRDGRIDWLSVDNYDNIFDLIKDAVIQIGRDL